MKVAELDKLVIKQEAQSIKKLHEVLSFLTDDIIHNDFDVYIALLHPQVYEAFVWCFKISVNKLVTPGFSPPYVPVFITVEDLRKSAYYRRINNKLAAAH